MYLLQKKHISFKPIHIDHGDTNFEVSLGGVYLNPLNQAVRSGLVEVSWVLIEKGAKANQVDRNGNSVLMAALHKEGYEVCKLVLDQKVYVNYVKYIGFSVLYLAAGQGLADICHLLIDYGADVVFKQVGIHLFKVAWGLQYNLIQSPT